MSAISTISLAATPVFIVLVILYGLFKRVDVYDAFIKGAKSGISTAFRVLPYVVGMIFAVDIFRASGCFDYMAEALAPVLRVMGIPAEVLPLAIMRPFSGGASMGMLAGVLTQFGADSMAGRIGATYMGSSETLFYTTSLYLGSVGISKTRYIVPVALLSDFFGLILSCLLCRLFF